MLEQLARDTTGWNARSVEFFELLSTTQHFNHVRLLNHRTADLRQAGKVELLNTPFDTITHTADVRHIASTRGRHNVPNVGVHLWRLQAYAVVESDARVIGNPADRSFTFDPAGGFWPISSTTVLNAITAPNLGKLNARTRPGKTSLDRCIVNPGAGYRRLENQLYRIEIHQSGSL